MNRAANQQTIVVATANTGKLAELQKALSGWNLSGIRVSPEEVGTTYEENALLKARFALANDPSADGALADDSGLEVEALPDELGVYSARFGGGLSDHEKNLLLLEKLEGKSRAARFVCVLALVLRDGREELFRGEIAGTIANGLCGKHGFGYDPLFIPDGEERTFAQMLPEEKALYSHRAKALEQLLRRVQP